MNRPEWFLAISVASVFYTWMGYPFALWVLARFAKGTSKHSQAALPRVSIIIAAHNEAAQIATKLDDCLALDYEGEQLEILVVSDGSSDATEHIVELYAETNPRIRLLRTQGRVGKSQAQNLAVR